MDNASDACVTPAGERKFATVLFSDVSGFTALSEALDPEDSREIGGIADLLQPDRWGRGVDVRVRDGRVIVDLYVIIQYGTRISEVAHGVMHGVQYALEQALGLEVVEVNVHVQGLRMPNGD